MRNKYHTLISNTAIFAVGSIGSRLISFLLVPLYTNVLTTDQYGTADLIITAANLLIPLVSLVIQDSVLRFGLSADVNHGSVLKNACLIFICGVVVAFSVMPLLSLYAPIAEWRYYLLLITVSSMASTILYAYAKSKEQNKLYAIASIINTLVLALTNILLLVVYPCGVKGYLISNICANWAAVIVLFVFSRASKELRKSRFDFGLLKQMVAYSAPLIVNNLSWWILNSSDRVMVEHYCSPSALGLYTAASKIPALLSIVTAIFTQAWTVSSIKEYDGEQDQTFYSNVFKYFSLAMFFGAALVILIVKDFMKIYVGTEFWDSWRYVPFLVIGTVYYSFASFFGAIYGALRKNVNVAVTTFAAAIINNGINLALIPRIGIMAAVISTAVSYCAIGIFRMLNSRRFFSFQIKFIHFALSSIVIIVQAIIITTNVSNYLISALSLVVLTIININDIVDMSSWVKALIKERT